MLKNAEKNVQRSTGDKVSQLERALEEALVEREEILEAAEKEIEATKNIAIESEQKMMDDFEWKLREIEAEYRKKITDTEASKTHHTFRLTYILTAIIRSLWSC